jgi:hypothetical protein
MSFLTPDRKVKERKYERVTQINSFTNVRNDKRRRYKEKEIKEKAFHRKRKRARNK